MNEGIRIYVRKLNSSSGELFCSHCGEIFPTLPFVIYLRYRSKKYTLAQQERHECEGEEFCIQASFEDEDHALAALKKLASELEGIRANENIEDKANVFEITSEETVN